MNAPLSTRTSLRESLLVRMADEGMPVGAIARVTRVPSPEIWEVLKIAIEEGYLTGLPAGDWPPGSRRDGRAPTLSPVRIRDAERFVMPIQRVFTMTPLQARCVATLLARREIAKPSLHCALYDAEPVTHPKIVDVVICHVRRRLTPYQIRITTIWGRGYALAAADAEAILRRLREWESREALTGAAA